MGGKDFKVQSLAGTSVYKNKSFKYFDGILLLGLVYQ